MSDYVIWNPRIGAVGDDVYNIPGSTKLDSTIDSGAKQLIVAGNQAPYSPDPTVAQLQAVDSVGVNQIIGVVNHFCVQKGLAPVLYAGISTPIQWSKLAAIKTKIDAIRTAYGMSPYGWSSIFTSFAGGTGTTILGRHFAELRKAVAITLSVSAWDAAEIGQATQLYTYSGGWNPSSFIATLSNSYFYAEIRAGDSGNANAGMVRRSFVDSLIAGVGQQGKALYFTLVANQTGTIPVGLTPNPPSTFSLSWKPKGTLTALTDSNGGTPLLSGASPSFFPTATYGPFLITNSMVLNDQFRVWVQYDNDIAFLNSFTNNSATRDWYFGQSSVALNGYFTYQ